MKRITVKERQAVTDALGDMDRWSHQCHAAAIHLVRAKIFSGARVARGAVMGVPGQHSWVVLGGVYHPEAIIDPTWWSYVHPERPDVRYVTGRPTGAYHPHGSGMIWDTGCPASGGGEDVVLNADLSKRAQDFLGLCRKMNDDQPLDLRFWAGLANAPVGGWPAAEIIAAMDDTPEVSALVPIDILGHLTDRNPGGLYLPTDRSDSKESA